jgi:hypothetical protein
VCPILLKIAIQFNARSAYEGLRVLIIHGHQLQRLVNTFQEISVRNLMANHRLQEIVHGIKRQFVCRIGLM